MGKKEREALHHTREIQKRIRAIAYVMIGVAVLGLAGYFLVSAFFRPALPALAGNVVDVKGAMDGFDLKTIWVKAGQPVTIRLTSMDTAEHTDGGGKHQWAVDELKVSIVAPPLGSNYATFTPDKPGTYTYYCDICCGGRANPSMQGTLIVES